MGREEEEEARSDQLAGKAARKTPASNRCYGRPRSAREVCTYGIEFRKSSFPTNPNSPRRISPPLTFIFKDIVKKKSLHCTT